MAEEISLIIIAVKGEAVRKCLWEPVNWKMQKKWKIRNMSEYMPGAQPREVLRGTLSQCYLKQIWNSEEGNS